MIKKLPLLLSIVSALSLACLTAYQSEVISGLRVDLSKAFQKLTKTEQALEVEIARTEELSAEITLLRDSVSFLNAKVLDLGVKIHGLKTTITNLNDIIRKKEDKVAALTLQIDKLKSENKNNAAQIAELIRERDNALDQMISLDTQRSAVKKEKVEKEQEKYNNSATAVNLESTIIENEKQFSNIMEAPLPIQNWRVLDLGVQAERVVSEAPAIKTEDGNKMRSIIYDTKVNFQKVSVRNKELSSDLKRAKDDWKYVIMNLSFENKNLEQLQGEEFLVEINDKETGLLLPFNEYNPGYPESSNGRSGYKFVYAGNPVQVKYFNSQKKDGANYEVNVFYLRKGLTYPLTNGKIQIIQNNEILTQ